MIKNDRQYRITKAQARKFNLALQHLPKELKNSNLHPVIEKAHIDAVKSQFEELREEIANYEALKSGVKKNIQIKSFDDLPRALIQARIASGLSQQALARQLGLKEQQIQRYEATEYATASLSRINEVVEALGIQVKQQVWVQRTGLRVSKLLAQLNKLGLDRDFVLAKLLPAELVGAMNARGRENNIDNLALTAAAIIGKLYGWSTEAIFGPGPLALEPMSLASARFKMARNTDIKKISAYTFYAMILAQHVLDATSHLKPKKIPTDPTIVQKAILDEFGAMTFENALRYVWSLGIAVLPLNDPGVFHGVCMRIRGRNVIVLKQKVLSPDRWIVDLIHELRHAGQEPNEKEFTLVEESISAKDWMNSRDEQEAIGFAAEVLLNGKAEELAKECATKANLNVARLKSIVPAVAQKENVRVGILANYMAFRLSLDNHNWWGAANNLQPLGENPYKTARDVLLQNADFSRLNDSDKGLLLRALN